MNRHATSPQSRRQQAAATAIGGTAAAAVLGLLALAGPALASDCNVNTDICWENMTSHYSDSSGTLTDVVARARPTFVDIDADGDQDLFIGYNYDRSEGDIHLNKIAFYQNDGVSGDPRWNLVTDAYNGIDTGSYSTPTPTFVDIDADGDQDLFIGKTDGTLTFYRNIGDPRSPRWQFVTSDYNDIDVGSMSAPAFVDIDKDGDQDLFIGGISPPPPVGPRTSTIHFYRNTGSAEEARWDDPPTTPYDATVLFDMNFQPLPVFVDIDGDGDQDLFIGSAQAFL